MAIIIIIIISTTIIISVIITIVSLAWRIWTRCSTRACSSTTSVCMTPAATWCWPAPSNRQSSRWPWIKRNRNLANWRMSWRRWTRWKARFSRCWPSWAPGLSAEVWARAKVWRQFARWGKSACQRFDIKTVFPAEGIHDCETVLCLKWELLCWYVSIFLPRHALCPSVASLFHGPYRIAPWAMKQSTLLSTVVLLWHPVILAKHEIHWKTSQYLVLAMAWHLNGAKLILKLVPIHCQLDP